MRPCSGHSVRIRAAESRSQQEWHATIATLRLATDSAVSQNFGEPQLLNGLETDPTRASLPPRQASSTLGTSAPDGLSLALAECILKVVPYSPRPQEQTSYGDRWLSFFGHRILFLPSFALLTLLFLGTKIASADSGVFDLAGPRVEMTVTRAGKMLPISDVPNLQPGDRLWIHPDFPESQSVRYLLIVAFLRGSTNPPPDNWFTRAETWNQQVRQEGIVVTVPADAQQTLLFLAPETGGDFSTLRGAVRGQARHIRARVAGS